MPLSTSRSTLDNFGCVFCETYYRLTLQSFETLTFRGDVKALNIPLIALQRFEDFLYSLKFLQLSFVRLFLRYINRSDLPQFVHLQKCLTKLETVEVFACDGYASRNTLKMLFHAKLEFLCRLCTSIKHLRAHLDLRDYIDRLPKLTSIELERGVSGDSSSSIYRHPLARVAWVKKEKIKTQRFWEILHANLIECSFFGPVERIRSNTFNHAYLSGAFEYFSKFQNMRSLKMINCGNCRLTR